MSEINYDELATAIAKKIHALTPAERVLWTPKQCAEYISVSERHFMDRVAKTHGFPKPIQLPSQKAHGATRWLAVEVQNWVLSHKRVS